ncbi:MAG TPA: LacI family DNA-binding transcriptional regulator [Ktedonobacteraceae bacterium]|jgi:LacI family transcriptional regulator|nr:LacI family DNA-binding transcriptional regulator [Ktedonobacteraceae bacterium]
MKKKRAETDGTHTIWDIAEYSGVSIATVSRVLNGKPHISEATRQKVQEAIAALGYTGKNTGSLLEKEPPRLIGITSASMHSGEYAEILAGITEALHAHNARPVICPIPHRHNVGMSLLDRVMSDTTEGALLLGTTDDDNELIEAYHSGFPLVVIHPGRVVNAQLPVVAASRWSAARVATEHLLSLGHQRISLLAARFSQYSSQFNYDNTDSIAGYQAALLAAGLPTLSELICESERNTPEGGCQAALRILSLPEPPTAILALSDPLAIGALQAARAKSLEVPGHLSVIGFDDLEASRMTLPELTAIHQPFPEMGRVGVDMLFRLLNGQTLDVSRVELSSQLVVRDSTAMSRK